MDTSTQEPDTKHSGTSEQQRSPSKPGTEWAGGFDSEFPVFVKVGSVQNQLK